MIDFNTKDAGMSEIRTIALRMLNKQNLNLNNRLYVFGAQNKRKTDIFLSPDIPDIDLLSNYLQNVQNLSISVEKIGNPAPRSWIALRRNFRLKNKEKSAKICVLVALTLNNRIQW